jgi:hypothetical protein
MDQFRIMRALGLSFRAWARNFIPFTLLAALLYAPVVIWIATYDYSASHSLERLLDSVFLRPIYVLVGLSTLVAPMLTYRVIQELNGTRVSMLTSVKYGLRGILPAIIVAVIVNLLQLIPAGGIVGAILTCMWFVATPAAVAERLGPFAALSRSGHLTGGRRWGIFGLTFLMGLLLVGLLMLWIMPMFAADADTVVGSLRKTAILLVVTVGVFQTLTGIVQAVSYALLRQDKEGISHEELARVFE